MANDGRSGENELHSRKDNEMEERDQKTFGRVVLLSGIALLAVFIFALLVVQRAGRHIRPVNPDKHPTSRLVVGWPAQRSA